MSTDKNSYELGKFPVCAFTVQMSFIICFALLVDYNSEANSIHFTNDYDPIHGGKRPHENSVYTTYPVFQDVHVMTLVGFGFIFTFLKKYTYSGVGLNVFITSVLAQWAILCEGLSRLENGLIMLSIEQLIAADVAAMSGLITWGAVLGKISPLQTLIMAIVEVPFYTLTKWLVSSVLKAIDPGASVTCHMFGALFGLAVSFVIFKEEHKKHPNEKRREYSDLFAMIGTIFLWVYWPNFNAALESGDDRHRSILNTYLSLMASCVMTFAVSSLIDPQNRFTMSHVQSATLSGGVAIGAVSSTMLGPFAALIIGSMAGIISTTSLRYLTPRLVRKFRIHDSGGVHSAHGLCGIFAGLCGVLMAAMATTNMYGFGVYLIYPAMAPVQDSAEFKEVRAQLSLIKSGDGRSAGQQAAYQLAALMITIAISVTGGLITGLLLRLSILDPPSSNSLFDDQLYWYVADESEDEYNTEESETLHDEYNRHTPSMSLKPAKTVRRMADVIQPNV